MLKQIITHNGKFHADEVFGVCVLKRLCPDAEIVRTRDPEILEDKKDGVLMVDVGDGEYDHHGKNSPVRPNGQPYSSAGLIWRDFGVVLLDQEARRILNVRLDDEELCKMRIRIDRAFVKFIDLGDNGVMLNEDNGGRTTFSSIVSNMNARLYSSETSDEAFHKALKFADMTLDALVASQLSSYHGRDTFHKLVEDQGNPEILIMETPVDWKSHVRLNHKVVYVVHPHAGGGWTVVCAPAVASERSLRKHLPTAWRGLRDYELEVVSGVQGATFCHQAGFTAATKTRSSAIALAMVALKAPVSMSQKA